MSRIRSSTLRPARQAEAYCKVLGPRLPQRVTTGAACCQTEPTADLGFVSPDRALTFRGKSDQRF